MRVSLIMILSFYLVGCGKSFTDDTPKDDNELVIKSTDLVEIKVAEGSEVGEYNVVFTPKDDSKYSIIKHDHLNGEILELAVGVSGEFNDVNVTSGYVYKYEVGKFEEDKSFKKILEKEIKIPVDLKLEDSEERVLETENAAISTEGHSVLNINRLSFSKNSKLVTQGQKIHLKVNRLLSRGGSVISFNSDTKSKVGLHGRSGGELILDVKYANGDFQISMRGENGGDGIRPSALGEIGRGKKGSKGKADGAAVIEYFYGPQGSELERPKESCDRTPAKGSSGGKGKKGLKGNSGLPGGGTGLALIYIEESDNFKFSYSLEPGLGGKGSLGGLGGPGGHGGDSAGEWLEEIEYEDYYQSGYRKKYNKIPRVCSSKKGSQGPTGDVGPKGDDGPSGEIQKICIRKNKDEETSCFSENNN